MPVDKNSTFLEWSHKVLEELVLLNARFDALSEKHDSYKTSLENRLNSVESNLNSKIEKTNVLLSGNGTPEKGLIIRVDRLEQSESKRVWLLRATIVACIGAIVGTVASYFKH